MQNKPKNTHTPPILAWQRIEPNYKLGLDELSFKGFRDGHEDTYI